MSTGRREPRNTDPSLSAHGYDVLGSPLVAQEPSTSTCCLMSHPVLDVGDARRLDGPYLLELDIAAAEVVEQARATTEQHGHDVQLELVEEPGGQVLVDDLGAAPEHDVLTVRGLFGLLERPLDAVGDEVIGRAAVHRHRLTGVVGDDEDVV